MIVCTRDPKNPTRKPQQVKNTFCNVDGKNQLTKIDSPHIQMAKCIEKKIWETTLFIVTSNINTIKYIQVTQPKKTTDFYDKGLKTQKEISDNGKIPHIKELVGLVL